VVQVAFSILELLTTSWTVS